MPAALNHVINYFYWRSHYGSAEEQEGGEIEEVKRLVSQYALMTPCQSSLPSVVFGERSIPSIALSMILDKLKQVREKLSKLR